MIRFGIAGSGWRALFFLRVARACPDRFAVTGLAVRSLQKAGPLAREFGVDLFTSVEELVRKSAPPSPRLPPTPYPRAGAGEI